LAAGSRRDGDALDAHEVQFGRRSSPHLETKLDRLANAVGELVVGACLRVTAGEGRHPRDEVPVAVFLDDDIELTFRLRHGAAIVGPNADVVKGVTTRSAASSFGRSPCATCMSSAVQCRQDRNRPRSEAASWRVEEERCISGTGLGRPCCEIE
jgi:hypothetical protein